tara:strand:- start:203 stop:574 length:372 start_codon:yes stop_codon:yes gene_type:complete
MVRQTPTRHKVTQKISGDGNIQAAGDVKVFSDEWVEKNPWMKEANEKAAEELAPNEMCMFVNFPDGVPVPKLRKEWNRYAEWKEKQDANLAIFHEMMNEKGIRPGVGSVGERHKGWGNGKQRS